MSVVARWNPDQCTIFKNPQPVITPSHVTGLFKTFRDFTLFFMGSCKKNCKIKEIRRKTCNKTRRGRGLVQRWGSESDALGVPLCDNIMNCYFYYAMTESSLGLLCRFPQ